jgi:Flp pilus assembly protein TadD
MKNDAQNELINNKLNGWTEKTGEVLFAQATQLARNGMYIQAERALKLLSTYTPTSAKVYLLLGKIYAQQKRYNDAITQWQHVLEIEPKNPEAEAAIKRAKQEVQQTKST